mgnify:CR=1 FL=1
MYPALALIEVNSIAIGMVVSDACVKKAAVDLLQSRPIAPGRYITLFWGDVGEVEEAFLEGTRIAQDTLVGQLFLPGAHDSLIEALVAVAQPTPVDSIAIVELYTLSATLLSADAALKAADVQLLEMRLAAGIDGKGYFVLTGELYDVEAAVEAATEAIEPATLVRTETIAAPSPDFTDFIW